MYCTSWHRQCLVVFNEDQVPTSLFCTPSFSSVFEELLIFSRALNYSNLFARLFGTVPNTPIMTSTTVTFLFHNFSIYTVYIWTRACVYTHVCVFSGFHSHFYIVNSSIQYLSDSFFSFLFTMTCFLAWRGGWSFWIPKPLPPQKKTFYFLFCRTASGLCIYTLGWYLLVLIEYY